MTWKVSKAIKKVATKLAEPGGTFDLLAKEIYRGPVYPALLEVEAWLATEDEKAQKEVQDHTEEARAFRVLADQAQADLEHIHRIQFNETQFRGKVHDFVEAGLSQRDIVNIVREQYPVSKKSIDARKNLP